MLSLLTASKPAVDMDSIFFDLETEMENNISRDHICQYEASERRMYLL